MILVIVIVLFMMHKRGKVPLNRLSVFSYGANHVQDGTTQQELQVISTYFHDVIKINYICNPNGSPHTDCIYFVACFNQD